MLLKFVKMFVSIGSADQQSIRAVSERGIPPLDNRIVGWGNLAFEKLSRYSPLPGILDTIAPYITQVLVTEGDNRLS